jgi:hypothetical protein
MGTVFLKLKFEAPDMRSNQGNAWIIPGNRGRDADNWPLLTPHCATLSELEWHIDAMKVELEEIRKQAQKKFADPRSRRPDLSSLYPNSN